GEWHADEFVSKYHFRPEFELFDCNADPLEMNNLGSNPKYAKVVQRLKGTLDKWMADQGDLGIQTELEAIYHASKAMGKSKAEVDAAWAKRNAN
ncbi:MAG: sulfatase atsG, partial [Opitutales bacterium]